MERGIETLSDIELIAILIGSGCVGSDYKDVAKKVSKHIRQCFEEDRSLEFTDFTEILGMGKTKAMRIIAGIELGVRVGRINSVARMRLATRKDVANYFSYMADYKQENFVAAFLNARYEMIKKERISIGGLDKVMISPRDLLRLALKYNAYGVVIIHNHPSGDPTPSDQDRSVTQRLKKAADLMDIKLIDHVVISKNGWSGVDL